MLFRRSITFLFLALLGFAQEVLTNDSVIKMVKAGLSEALILSTLNQQPGKYSTSVDDLIKLKQAGVGDKVVAAMAAKGSSASSPATAPAAPADAGAKREVGVYFKKGGEWAEVLPGELEDGRHLEKSGECGRRKERLEWQLAWTLEP